jgi:hypothetical protein
MNLQPFQIQEVEGLWRKRQQQCPEDLRLQVEREFFTGALAAFSAAGYQLHKPWMDKMHASERIVKE